jgi:hypothetical protein
LNPARQGPKNFYLNKAVDKKRARPQLSTAWRPTTDLFILARQLGSTPTHTFEKGASACSTMEKMAFPHPEVFLIYYD